MNFINLVDLIQVFANEYSQPTSNVLLIGNSNIHGIFNFLNSDLIVVDNIPGPNIDFVVGKKLPFIKESFDLIICIHNIFEINEIYRVLKPQGKFICLEFSKINDLWLQKLYDLYSFKIIPKIGGLVLNDVDSYQYLVESIRVFPDQENFLQLINQAGFVNSGYQNLSCGVACLH